MLELLNKFSVAQIILFIILLAIAFKKVADFLDWFKEWLNKKISKKKLEESTDERLDKLETSVLQMSNSINQMAQKVDVLMDSDKDDIKAWITKEHHLFCYDKKWIDDYSLDCIEKRYSHYIEENGNSFVADLMKEIRNLPKQKPE